MGDAWMTAGSVRGARSDRSENSLLRSVIVTVMVVAVAALVVPVSPSTAAPDDAGTGGTDDSVVPAARSASVSPDVGLVHGQPVEVTGSGWPAGGIIGVGQCAAAATDLDQCEILDAFVSVDRSGRFTTTQQVEAVLDTDSGLIDCRAEPCVIGVNDTFSVASAVRVPIELDPGGPDPPRAVLSVTPDTGLVDQQEVAVTASGFDPATALIADLAPDGTIEGFRDVDGILATPRVATALGLPDGVRDCRLDPCQLVLTTGTCEFSEAGLAPLMFDPDGPEGVPGEADFAFPGRCSFTSFLEGGGDVGIEGPQPTDGGHAPAGGAGPIAASPPFTG